MKFIFVTVLIALVNTARDPALPISVSLDNEAITALIIIRKHHIDLGVVKSLHRKPIKHYFVFNHMNSNHMNRL